MSDFECIFLIVVKDATTKEEAYERAREAASDGGMDLWDIAETATEDS